MFTTIYSAEIHDLNIPETGTSMPHCVWTNCICVNRVEHTIQLGMMISLSEPLHQSSPHPNNCMALTKKCICSVIDTFWSIFIPFYHFHSVSYARRDQKHGFFEFSPVILRLSNQLWGNLRSMAPYWEHYVLLPMLFVVGNTCFWRSSFSEDCSGLGWWSQPWSLRLSILKVMFKINKALFAVQLAMIVILF